MNSRELALQRLDTLLENSKNMILELFPDLNNGIVERLMVWLFSNKDPFTTVEGYLEDTIYGVVFCGPDEFGLEDERTRADVVLMRQLVKIQGSEKYERLRKIHGPKKDWLIEYDSETEEPVNAEFVESLEVRNGPLIDPVMDPYGENVGIWMCGVSEGACVNDETGEYLIMEYLTANNNEEAEKMEGYWDTIIDYADYSDCKPLVNQLNALKDLTAIG